MVTGFEMRWRSLLPWAISAALLFYVFGYATNWSRLIAALEGADVPRFLLFATADRLAFFTAWAWLSAIALRRFVAARADRVRDRDPRRLGARARGQQPARGRGLRDRADAAVRGPPRCRDRIGADPRPLPLLRDAGPDDDRAAAPAPQHGRQRGRERRDHGGHHVGAAGGGRREHRTGAIRAAPLAADRGDLGLARPLPAAPDRAVPDRLRRARRSSTSTSSGSPRARSASRSTGARWPRGCRSSTWRS